MMNGMQELHTKSPKAGPRAAYSDERGMDGGFMNEAEAMRIAIHGTRAQRLWTGLKAFSKLLRNPDDTTQIFLMGIVLNAPMFPHLLLRMMTSDEGVRLVEERPLINTKTVDFDALRKLPASTLGGAYVRYLDENKLDPDLFKPPPGLPAVPRWVATRVRQTHDVWHALTGYGPDVPGELALQAFTYGQLGMPSAVMVATLGTLTRAPRSMLDVARGYRRGKAAKFLPTVRFESMWQRPLEEVRRELGIAPLLHS
jgi:ubiquinone biosynthesis protein COQ4